MFDQRKTAIYGDEYYTQRLERAKLRLAKAEAAYESNPTGNAERIALEMAENHYEVSLRLADPQRKYACPELGNITVPPSRYSYEHS